MASDYLSSAHHSHLSALKEKSAKLKSKIQETRSRVPHPDDYSLKELQKQNLKLEDQIFIIEKMASGGNSASA